jgi:hypothetical protein
LRIGAVDCNGRGAEKKSICPYLIPHRDVFPYGDLRDLYLLFKLLFEANKVRKVSLAETGRDPVPVLSSGLDQTSSYA